MLDPLSRLEMSLSPEIMERIDEAVELLGYSSREDLVLCVIRRFLDRYLIPKIRARANITDLHIGPGAHTAPALGDDSFVEMDGMYGVIRYPPV